MQASGQDLSRATPPSCKMPKNDLEVFESLTGQTSTSLEIDFIAYAMFAYQKKEWIKHHQNQTGTAPSQIEIDGWITNITDFQFENMRNQAVEFFDSAARRYLEEEIESGKREILETTIVKKVAAAGAFWKQLAIALLTSILAPLILGGIIAAILVFERYPGASQISSKLIQGSPAIGESK